jgi:hypothetical protein
MAAQTLPGVSGMFQHLPPMPGKMFVAPPKHIVAEAQTPRQRQCAIPLLNVTPDNHTHYAIRPITPPKDQVGPMAYVTADPTCAEPVR